MKKDLKDKVTMGTGGSSGIGRAAALGAMLGALPALYGWAVRSMLRRKLNRLKAGDAGPLFGIYAEDVRLVLSGRHSWAGTTGARTRSSGGCGGSSG